MFLLVLQGIRLGAYTNYGTGDEDDVPPELMTGKPA